MLEFVDNTSFERVPAAGTNVKIEVPVINAAAPGGISLADLAGLLEPQEFDPDLEQSKTSIYGAPVSVLPAEDANASGEQRKTRMVEVIVQRASASPSLLSSLIS